MGSEKRYFFFNNFHSIHHFKPITYGSSLLAYVRPTYVVFKATYNT